MKIARIFEKIENTFTAEFGDSVVTDKKELVKKLDESISKNAYPLYIFTL